MKASHNARVAVNHRITLTIRSSLIFGISVVSLFQLAAAAQENGSGTITPQGNGPYHQLVLPAWVHGASQRADLSDLRITNGTGNAVPYAWVRNEGPAPEPASAPVPLFAVPESAQPANTSEPALAFKVLADGTLALTAKATARTSKHTTNGPPPAQWLMDVSKIKGRLLQAQLTVAPDTTGLFSYRLEFSNDLRTWRNVGSGAPEQLVVLQQGGQRIERLSADLQGVQAKYLRLQWQDPQAAPLLTGVTIDSVQDGWLSPLMEWTTPITAQDCVPDFCDYLVPRGLPAHSLRLQLSQINTLAPLRISGVLEIAPPPEQQRVVRNPLYALRRAHRATEARTTPLEVLLQETVVYRLALQGVPLQSPELPLDGGIYTRIRLRTQGAMSALGPTPPTLEIASPQRALVFLAQGAPPFSLQWSDAAPGVAMSLGALLPGYANGKLPAVDKATIRMAALDTAPTATASAAQAAEPAKTSKYWLWGALAIGLALLAAMAASLLKNVKAEAE